MKACKDCKYCVPETSLIGVRGYKFARCVRKNIENSAGTVNKVSGVKYDQINTAFCSVEREYHHLCGEEAGVFEPILTEKSATIFERMGLPKIKFPKIRIVK